VLSVVHGMAVSVGVSMSEQQQQRWTGWFYITKEEWDRLSEKYRITMCFEELDLMIEIRSRQDARLKQCENCVRKESRDCMYHGYPEETIPISCAYKIGEMAVHTVYDVPTVRKK
jgi:hypothetical protein